MPKTHSKTLDEFREELLRDPEVKAAYDALGPYQERAKAVMQYRAEHGLMQRQLANQAGVPLTVVRRVEDMDDAESDFMVRKLMDYIGG